MMESQNDVLDRIDLIPELDFKSIDHIAIAVHDIEQAVQFYTQILY